MTDDLFENAKLLLPWMPVATLAFGLITFIAGHFMGHRAAVKRDKRKEYNAIVAPVRVQLIKQIESLQSDDFLNIHISKDEIILISEKFRNPNVILSCFKDYKHATSYEGMKCKVEHGIVIIQDRSMALEFAQKLLRLIPLK